MVRLFLAGVGFAALIAQHAMAADLAVRSYAVPAPPVGWSGLYVGANAGGTWSSANNLTITTSPQANFGGLAAVEDANAAAASASGILGSGRQASFIGGGQAGYNWQLGSFLVGVEADIQWAVGRGGGSNGATGVGLVGPDSAAPGTTDLTAFTASSNLTVLGTLRGRAGYLVSPALLAYATGGLAYGSISGSAGFTTSNPAYPAIGQSSPWGVSNVFSAVRAGWTLGGGLEWMFMPGFTAKAEYLYYDLGSVTADIGTSGSILLAGFPGAPSPWFTNASTISVRTSGSILRVGLNYQLGDIPALPRF
jgi:outer membrane immunogenic protein